MIVQLQRDTFNNIIPPKVYLCQTNREIIGELSAYGLSGDFKWNTYSEIQFSLDYKYTDVITGEQKVHPLFDKVEGLRPVLLAGVGYFTIQDSDTVYGDQDNKTLTAFSLEYSSAGTKYLENFYVNTGAEESKEVIYHTDKNGADYFDHDSIYKNATAWGAYTQYYVKDYNSDGSFTWAQEQVKDEAEFNELKDTLYVKSWPSVQFYDPTTPELSLLHLVFKRIPEWKIGHVDRSLYTQVRKFEEQRISVYDFLMSKVSDTFKCVVSWNSLDMTVDFYEEAEDGIDDNNAVATRWDSDIFISKENLASQIDIKMSSDNIKTKLKVSGGEDLGVSEVNLGQNYIINLNYYHTVDWMGQDLYLRYHDYMRVVEENTEKYEAAVKARQGAYNRQNDMYYSVPVEKDVLLVGDEFTQLYCIYDTVDALKKWLDIYGVMKDTKATKSDNVLLTLQDENGNTSTIRVYYDETEGMYLIKRIVVNGSTGGEVPTTYTLDKWVGNELTSDEMNLSKYTIKSIGTLGAYLCLTVDESDPKDPVLQEYGIGLLKEKQEVYTKIFITQTERLMSQENAVCVAGDTPPSDESAEIADGTKWLDTSNSNMIILREYNKSNNVKWKIVEIASTEQPEGDDWDDGIKWLDTDGAGGSDEVVIYRYNKTTHSWILSEDTTSDTVKSSDYTVYLENFAKLTAIKQILAEKERLYKFYSDGVAIQGRYITSPTKKLLKDAAKQYFGADPIDYPTTFEAYDEDLVIYAFTIKGDESHYAIYIKNNIPYVAYLNSTYVWQLKMNYYKSVTNMETFFTEDEWMKLSPFIREDEFTDDNFALNGYESEEERADICRQLLKNAQKELKTLSQPSLEFSMTMANILAIPEFEKITGRFKLGSFIRVGVRPDYVKRARLLEVHINFDDMSDFSVNFGNLITTKSEIDKHAELLSQAIQAGKTVATSASSWQKALDKTNKIDDAIADGLTDATLEVGKANGQSIEIGQYGIWGRKLIDGTIDQYEDEQFRLVNNKILFSDDGFQTSKALFGKFTFNDNTHYGVLTDAVVGGYIKGSAIEGGSLKISGTGGTFIVHEDGSVQILSANTGDSVYATKSDIDSLNNARQYHIELSYDNSTMFSRPDQTCTLTCKVYEWDDDITTKLPSDTKFSWLRNGTVYKTTTVPTLTITNSDIERNAIFSCSITFDETQII